VEKYIVITSILEAEKSVGLRPTGDKIRPQPGKSKVDGTTAALLHKTFYTAFA
jgi:hypothetical protein